MFRFARMTAQTTLAPQTDVKIETLEDATIGQNGPGVPGSDLMEDIPEEEEMQMRPSPEDSFLFRTGGAGPDIGGGLFEDGEEEIQTRPAAFETRAICPEDPPGPLSYGCDPLDPPMPDLETALF